MTTTYTFTLPAGASPDDCVFAGVAGATIPKPDAYAPHFDGTTTLTVTYISATLTGAQQTNFQALCNTNPHPPAAPWNRQATLLAALAGVPTVLRNQATQAAGTTVTGPGAGGNIVAVTQTVVNDLAIFCARLADLLEALGVPV